MLNLIRRDVIIQKRNLIGFIPFVLFFVIMNSHPALTFLVASIFIPFNTFDYDKKAETNILLNSLPYTRQEIIAARYIGAIVYMILAIGLTSVALFAFNKSFTLTDIAIGSGLYLLFVALAFPLFYIFKGNITLIIMISFILLVGIVPPTVYYLAEHFPSLTNSILNLSNIVLYTSTAIVIVVLYVISWVTTTFVYQRKGF
ncbi:MAG TPA: ABC-2 transporter permease [Pseudogracilibacillus sp.]|nr:ABC-2 transporter permease [Pseudogracilibacillus sp.]